MLQRSPDRGIKLNPEKKCILFVTEVLFFGNVLSADGLKPDPAKVTAIKEMPAPTNRGELETILGMVNYLSKFTTNLAEVTSPLRQLLKKEHTFQWDQQQGRGLPKDERFNYDRSQGRYWSTLIPKKDVTLEVDASQCGLGAALLQDSKPVAYASKSLTSTEQQYAQIEKEMYAILFGREHFHQYIYGRHITVVTDHKPLESITKKPVAAAPARLQRMMLRIQKYGMTVVHVQERTFPSQIHFHGSIYQTTLAITEPLI